MVPASRVIPVTNNIWLKHRIILQVEFIDFVVGYPKIMQAWSILQIYGYKAVDLDILNYKFVFLND